MKFNGLLNYFLSLILIFIVSFPSVIAQNEEVNIDEKYVIYRERLLNDWILISEDVEQFGVNIPAVDRRIDDSGNTLWLSWSDGNSNFNHWLGILSTEYKLLKNSNQDYQETLKMLFYSMVSLERIDLYSEYALRVHHGITGENDNEPGFINYPDDINGFLLRDDVSLGFWMQYHGHFNSNLGNIVDTKDGTSSYLSVFRRGVIPKQGMSQDNIIYLLQSLALVKFLVDDESIADINYNFYNHYIPAYLTSKGIFRNDSVYFGRWVDDITDRLLKHVTHEYPEKKIVLKPKDKFRARPSDVKIGGILSSYWYIMNPVTNTLVAEGNGEDMGVWMNSYGMAEAANYITGKNIYHTDGSDKGLSRYIFKSLLFKDFRFLGAGGIPLPEGMDDYMIRALASVADINWKENSYKLLYLLGDKRDVWTYEHNPLVLVILHNQKYGKIYKPGMELYDNDKKYYENMLGYAPVSGPSTDYRRSDYHPYWSTSSRLNWPENHGKRNVEQIWEYAGMDYMFLYNLYKLVFDPDNYSIDTKTPYGITTKTIKKYNIPDMKDKELQYFYLPPKEIEK